VLLVLVLIISDLILVACLLGGRLTRRRLERELAEAQDAARIEELTMLGNRRAFEEDLQLEVLRSDRTGDPVCVVILALTPDPSGEAVDEHERRDLARVMRSEVRAIDLGYRTGVNEFALIMPNTRAWGAELAARRIAEADRGTLTGCGLAAGLAESGPGIDRSRLFRNAYCALLATGAEGDSRVRAFSEELDRSGLHGELEGLPEIGTLDEPVS
jgi:GGDEF domain-containing protein